jgi:hypothetical protein
VNLDLSSPILLPSALLILTHMVCQDIATSSMSALITRPDATQVNVNIPYEIMSRPVQGPVNPFETNTIGKSNTLTGTLSILEVFLRRPF